MAPLGLFCFIFPISSLPMAIPPLRGGQTRFQFLSYIPRVAGDHYKTMGGDTMGGWGRLGRQEMSARQRAPGLCLSLSVAHPHPPPGELCAQMPGLLLSLPAASPLSCASCHSSSVSSMLPCQYRAWSWRWVARDGRALGLVPALSLLSPQDPDPCRHPAAPTGDVPTATQAPCPVSGSRAFCSLGIGPLFPWAGRGPSCFCPTGFPLFLESGQVGLLLRTCPGGTGLSSLGGKRTMAFGVRPGFEAQLCRLPAV